MHSTVHIVSMVICVYFPDLHIQRILRFHQVHKYILAYTYDDCVLAKCVIIIITIPVLSKS